MMRTYGAASSGMISGSGFAIANTIGSFAIFFRSSTVISPGDHVGELPLLVERVGVLRVPVLHEVHVLLPALVDRPHAVHADDVARSGVDRVGAIYKGRKQHM